MPNKLIQINTVCNNSTGRIMHDIQIAAEETGYETLSIVGRRKPYTDVPCLKYGNAVSFWIHVFITMIFDKQGWGSFFATKKIVKRLRAENPDIIHLHNIHGYYINMPVLFRYLCKEYKGKVFWTFHDCWPFTGHCPYYVMADCNKWQEECFKCSNKKLYPSSIFMDASRNNYKWKKKNFLQLKNLTILVPSKWLYCQVKQSFFGECNICLAENGIDQKVFYPQDGSKIIRKYHVEEKKMLLGVASIWELRKGLGVFFEIANAISEDYVIVLVGLSQRQCRRLPKNVIGIQRTEDATELAKLYSAASIFVNPSYEETFSLVTVEAMSCGTPVIVRSGSATEELLIDECGIVLHDNSIEAYLDAIEKIVKRNIDKDKIVERARLYSKEKMSETVLKLYRQNVE